MSMKMFIVISDVRNEDNATSPADFNISAGIVRTFEQLQRDMREAQATFENIATLDVYATYYDFDYDSLVIRIQ